jgi:gas vesicle protein
MPLKIASVVYSRISVASALRVSIAQFLNSQIPEIPGTSMAEITKEEMRERLGNIDQIRDIIFGAQLREYDNRFDKIDSDLSMMQQDMQARIEQVKTVLSGEMKAAVDSLEKKVKSLTSNTQEESADIRQQVDRVNRKFSSSMEALDEAIDNQTSSLRDELSQTRERLSEETRTLKTQVFEELDRRFSMLRDVKVSRDDMAEILFELGMRLKGTEFVPELKGVADNKLNTEFLLPERHHHG